MSVSCIIITGYDVTREIVEDLAEQMKPGESVGNLERDGHNYVWEAFDMGKITGA